MKLIIAFILIFMTIGCYSQNISNKPFELAKNGKPVATIIIDKNPSKSANYAALELQYHLKLITGADFNISDDYKIKGNKIFLGSSEGTDKLGYKNLKFNPREFMIKYSGDNLVIMGLDELSKAKDDDLEFIKGVYGKAVKFNGINNGVNFGNINFNDDEGTFECFVYKPANNSDKDSTLFRLDGTTPWTYHILQLEANSNTIGYRYYDGTNVSTIYSPALNEGWHHLFATYSAKKGYLELIIDGKSCGKNPYKKTSCNKAPICIGGTPANSKFSNVFNGAMDDVRVSSIAREYNAETYKKPLEKDEYTLLYTNCDTPNSLLNSNQKGPQTSVAPDLFDEKGTLNGVYEFLEKYCNVRWYAPTEVGIVYPKNPNLKVIRKDLKHEPKMSYLYITPTNLYMPTTSDPIPTQEVSQWKLRMRLGGEKYAATHSFYSYFWKYGKTHPEYFAQGYEKESEPPQMCYTNRAFIEQCAKDASEFFASHTTIGAAMGDYYALVPMDNDKWCKCANCQAWLGVDDKDNKQFTTGKASNYIWNFVNEVAKIVKKTNPDKYIVGLAYWDYGYYPTKVKLEDNVAVQMCLHVRNWYSVNMKQTDLKVFDAWTKDKNRREFLWLYYNFPALNATYGKFDVFPAFSAKLIATQMDMYNKNNIRGIFMEHSSEFEQPYLGDQLEFYTTFKLADDPTLKVDKLMDEFFKLYYGSASEPMKVLYNEIEDTYFNTKNYPPEVSLPIPAPINHMTKEYSWKYLGTPERMERWQKLMDEAKSSATGIYKERVDIFEKSIWDEMLKGYKDYYKK